MGRWVQGPNCERDSRAQGMAYSRHELMVIGNLAIKAFHFAIYLLESMLEKLIILPVSNKIMNVLA
jgi:hypothetical protein